MTTRESQLSAALMCLAWYAQDGQQCATPGYREAYQRAVELVGEPPVERPACKATPGDAPPADAADALAEAVRALLAYQVLDPLRIPQYADACQLAESAISKYDAAKEGAR